jgi:phage terminase large subunit
VFQFVDVSILKKIGCAHLPLISSLLPSIFYDFSESSSIWFRIKHPTKIKSQKVDFIKALLLDNLLNIPKGKFSYFNEFINALHVHICLNGTDLLLSASVLQLAVQLLFMVFFSNIH